MSGVESSKSDLSSDFKDTSPKTEGDPKRVDLIDEDFDITDDLEAALREIFKRYDLDQDEALNKEELDSFATFTNGHPFSSHEIDEIKQYFNCNEKGDMTLAGFIEMYALQTSSGDEDETWKDLIRHGYDKHLKLSST